MSEIVDITSFIIRVVRTESPTQPPISRGSIRHIQSNAEINFSNWEQAVEFMQHHVTLMDASHPTVLPVKDQSAEQ